MRVIYNTKFDLFSKFLFTAPDILTVSKNEKMFLNIFDNPGNSDFTIKLTNPHNGSEIHSVTVINASKFVVSLLEMKI
jgi:hypothetical protein